MQKSNYYNLIQNKGSYWKKFKFICKKIKKKKKKKKRNKYLYYNSSIFIYLQHLPFWVCFNLLVTLFCFWIFFYSISLLITWVTFSLFLSPPLNYCSWSCNRSFTLNLKFNDPSAILRRELTIFLNIVTSLLFSDLYNLFSDQFNPFNTYLL